MESYRAGAHLSDFYRADLLRHRVDDGIVGFDPQPIALAARFIGNTASPIVVFMINGAVAATVVTVSASALLPAKKLAGAVICLHG